MDYRPSLGGSLSPAQNLESIRQGYVKYVGSDSVGRNGEDYFAQA